MFLLASNP